MESNLSEDVTRRGVVLSTCQAGAELRSKKRCFYDVTQYLSHRSE